LKLNRSGNSKTPEEIFKAEFDRIMKENEIYRERQSTKPSTSSWDSSKHRIKINNGGYNIENLDNCEKKTCSN